MLENVLEAIPRNDNLFPIADAKYVERQIVYYDKDGKRFYGVYYNILDQYIEEVCYWGEGYISENLYLVEEFYNQLSCMAVEDVF